VRVLILGAGGAASNGFARALRMAGGYELVGTNCSETDLLLSECEENHLIPHVEDLDGWRQALYEIMNKDGGGFVHAQSDREVRGLAGLRNVAHQCGWKTYLPSTGVIDVCQDKWSSYQMWRDAGVPVPDTWLASSRGVVRAALAEYGEIWLRPRTGAGGQKALRTKNFDLAYGWLNERNGWGFFTCAEALSKDTVTVQLLYWKGALQCSQQRIRESWANAGSTTTGVSGATGVGVTSSMPLADEIAEAAVAAVDSEPHGLYGVDMVRTAHGLPRVTEINVGRFFTTMPELCAMANYNMAAIYVSNGAHDGIVSVWQPDRNPIPDGYRWIRSLDHMPVLDRPKVYA
jgi:hypothetical protein